MQSFAAVFPIPQGSNWPPCIMIMKLTCIPFQRFLCHRWLPKWLTGLNITWNFRGKNLSMMAVRPLQATMSRPNLGMLTQGARVLQNTYIIGKTHSLFVPLSNSLSEWTCFLISIDPRLGGPAPLGNHMLQKSCDWAYLGSCKPGGTRSGSCGTRWTRTGHGQTCRNSRRAKSTSSG